MTKRKTLDTDREMWKVIMSEYDIAHVMNYAFIQGVTDYCNGLGEFHCEFDHPTLRYMRHCGWRRAAAMEPYTTDPFRDCWPGDVDPYL